MDFGFSESQEMLRTMARDFLEKECPKKLVGEMEEDERGYPPGLWKKMADLGWQGLCLPQRYGGGGNFLDLCILVEEMGRACLPGPFFSTVVLGALTLLDVGSEQQKMDILPRVSSGDVIMTLALTEPSARYDASVISLSAVRSGGGYILEGTKLFVPDAHIADWIIVVAKANEGISLFLVEGKASGITTTQLKTIAKDKQCEVLFNKVKVDKEALVGELGKGWAVIEKALQRATVAKCCEMVGGARQALEMTVDYAKQREQFNRPVGSFQAIQHYCANMLVDVEGSRLIAYQAAWMMSEGLPCRKEVAMAKAWVSQAYRRITALGHQIYGTIAWVGNHDLQLYYRRAKSAELAFGDADFHREVVAQELTL